MTAPALFEKIAAAWRPDPVLTSEVVHAAPARAMAGLFDVMPPLSAGDPLPPLWHWLYLLDRPAQAELGEDGHPRDGLFLPPLPERRRMFGGGRLEFRAPILIGDEVARSSEIASVRVRQGGSGWLLLVTVRHELSVRGEVRTLEEQDIVYKQPGPVATARSFAPGADPGTAAWSFALRPDPVLLFRFSALTYNAHRIHYDRDYAVGVEGYPGLVVHGPLLAMALLELPRRHAPERAVRSFAWRARSPLFDHDEIVVVGTPGEDGASLGAGPPGVQASVFGSVTF